ncbi:2-oxo-4-hydroxy-4-carboxy-5-ureidoimidazoline decarboxylase [Dasania marina]|uniref:2-oxo-4-hydroxy-4-carboxy-5-ureidoimidazoline decarboxylase n=1 Tax=Dasania marina TaxID=471499 RepID=UPI0030DC482C|tara:strand:- start:10644 stop:11162 length:519 start_codon:yes stop_codon:yes gene_type:complete
MSNDVAENLNQLNSVHQDIAAHTFRQCCTSEAWIKRMVKGRPYKDDAALISAADKYWQGLSESDYLQAFDGHPKIGDVNSLKVKYANTKVLAAGEQSLVNDASDDIINTIAKGNSDYESKFGFIFIVCATGKSAAEMSELLQQRLINNRATELLNAAEEQRKIFQIRLRKLL